MSWFCNTKEAKEQMELCNKNKCMGCSKCIGIEESANAMSEYHEMMEEEKNKVVVEKEAPLIYDKSIKRWTKGGKLHD